MKQGRRRLILAVDVSGYSKHDYGGQEDAQIRLQRLAGYALRRAGVSTVRVQRQEQGDGQLVLFPAGVDETRLVPSLILGLRDGLYHLNRVPGAFGRLRIRAALGQGPVWRSANGYVGDAVVQVSRLLDATALRAALDEVKTSDLALALSPELYREIICREPSGLETRDFYEADVVIPAKEFRSRAWLHVPEPGPAPDARSDVRWGRGGSGVVGGAVGAAEGVLPFSPDVVRTYALPSIAVMQAVIMVRHLSAGHGAGAGAHAGHAPGGLAEWTVPGTAALGGGARAQVGHGGYEGQHGQLGHKGYETHAAHEESKHGFDDDDAELEDTLELTHSGAEISGSTHDGVHDVPEVHAVHGVHGLHDVHDPHPVHGSHDVHDPHGVQTPHGGYGHHSALLNHGVHQTHESVAHGHADLHHLDPHHLDRHHHPDPRHLDPHHHPDPHLGGADPDHPVHHDPAS